jgi:ribosomal protein S18 acetylase RimI-like enzyme
MRVRAIHTMEEFQRYANFGREVYDQSPYWIEPDPHHLTELLSGAAPFGSHALIQPFWVEDGDRLLATVTAVIDETFNAYWKEQIGHLLSFEALPGQEDAVQSLIDTACVWLREHGCAAARMSFLYGWQLPLTIDAYEAVPTVFHTYNPTYYHSYIKNSGFVTESGQVEYQVRFTPELASGYQQMVERVSSSGVILKSWDFDDLEKESVTFLGLYNETFASHWGASQFTLPEMQRLVKGLKDFLVQDFTVFAEVDGQAIGGVFSLPDLNQAFSRMKGEVIEENFPKLLQFLQSVDHGVLLIIGVKPQFRGQGINLAMAAKSYLAMIERGYKTASYTLVLDNNWPSRRTAEKLGARVTRNFNVYRKEPV